MKTFDLILAWLMVVLGFIHCGATFVLHRSVTLGAIWFFAFGVALVQGGLLNVIRNRGGRGVAHLASLFGNLLLLLMSVAVLLLTFRELLHSPQVILVFVAVVAETIFSIRA